MGLFFEAALQRWYLDLPGHGFIEFWNVFYGTAHFLVTAGALVWLYRRDSERYPRWRNSLAFTTLLALIGFASFSLMPPRLLDEPLDRFGPPAGVEDAPDTFVDTLAEYPTFWSFDSGTLKSISNQYAAMPSLHVGWSLWAAFVLFPLLRRRWAKVAGGAAPGRHAVLHHRHGEPLLARRRWAGAAIFGTGTAIGFALDRWWERRRAGRTPSARRPAPAPATP